MEQGHMAGQGDRGHHGLAIERVRAGILHEIVQERMLALSQSVGTQTVNQNEKNLVFHVKTSGNKTFLRE
jgi:hypothetical protein